MSSTSVGLIALWVSLIATAGCSKNQEGSATTEEAAKAEVPSAEKIIPAPEPNAPTPSEVQQVSIPGEVKLDAEGFSDGLMAEVALVGTPGDYEVRLTGSATDCKAEDGNRWPWAVLNLDNGPGARVEVNARKSKEFVTALSVPKSGARLQVLMEGDLFLSSDCDRNISVAGLTFVAKKTK